MTKDDAVKLYRELLRDLKPASSVGLDLSPGDPLAGRTLAALETVIASLPNKNDTGQEPRMTTADSTTTPVRSAGTAPVLIGTVSMFANQFDDFHFKTIRVEFHRMNSPFYTGEKWAVRNIGFCMSRTGEWVYEPMPSQRDEESYAAFRFDTLEQAVETYHSANNPDAAMKRMG